MSIDLDPRTGNPDMTSYFRDAMGIKPKPKQKEIKKEKKKLLSKEEKQKKILTKYNSLISTLKDNSLITFCEYNNYGNLTHNQENTYKLVKIIMSYHNRQLTEKETISKLGYLPKYGRNKYYLYHVKKNDIEKIYKILLKEVKKWKRLW